MPSSPAPQQPRLPVPGWAVAAGLTFLAGALGALAWYASQRLAPPADDRTVVRNTVRAWSAALADQDGSRACSLMSATARQQLAALQTAEDCQAAALRLSTVLSPGARDLLRDTAVRDVTFPASGRAIVTLGAPGQELELRRDGDRWLISDLMTTIRATGGGAYPLGPVTSLPTAEPHYP